MSGITGISGNSASLLSLLSQAESGLGGSSLLDSLVAPGIVPTASEDSGTSATTTGSSSDLQEQIQSAVTAALQSAEQLGSSDLKGVVYNALVQVLVNNGIDPKTLQPTANTSQSGTSGSQQQSVDSSTSAVLAQVMAALSGASAASDPVAQLTSAQDGSQGSSDLLSLLSTSQNNTESSSNQGSDLLSLLSTSQNNSLFSTQNNSQNLLGFLYDSGQ